MQAHSNRIGEDGLYYSPSTPYPQRDKAWARLGPHMYPTVGVDFVPLGAQHRLMTSMMIWRQFDGNPMWDDYLRHMAKAPGDIAVHPVHMPSSPTTRV